jgi:phospholipid-binding lipoprotein MlaA
MALCISASVLLAHGSMAAEQHPDPLEPINRAVFQFNEAADRWVLKPVATTYSDLAPRPVQAGIGNALRNLRDVNYALNALFQGRVQHALSNTGRVVMNSTLGLAGAFDVATPAGIESNYADFGQTLSTWGIPAGPFVMLPVIGPSTLRDGAGFAVDAAVLSVPSRIPSDDVRLALWGTAIVHARAQLTNLDDLITGDRYIFFRDAYLQRRAEVLGDPAPYEQESFGDFGDFGEFDDYEDDLPGVTPGDTGLREF